MCRRATGTQPWTCPHVKKELQVTERAARQANLQDTTDYLTGTPTRQFNSRVLEKSKRGMKGGRMQRATSKAKNLGIKGGSIAMPWDYQRRTSPKAITQNAASSIAIRGNLEKKVEMQRKREKGVRIGLGWGRMQGQTLMQKLNTPATKSWAFMSAPPKGW